MATSMHAARKVPQKDEVANVTCCLPLQVLCLCQSTPM